MRWRWGLALGALAVAGAVAWSIRRPASRPNVVFIVWDTVRADHLSLYGHGRATTPRLDAWARDAVVFDRARSPGIWTLPSHASMFTGNPVPSTGADERWMWLDGAQLTLAEVLKGAGYATFSFAANALLCKETQLTQGFDVVTNSYRGRLAALAARNTRSKLLPADASHELAPLWRPPAHGATNSEWARAAYKEAAPLGVEATLRWIDRQDGPFFAFLNLMEAHTPRLPSVESRRALFDADLHGRALTTDASHIRLHFANFGKDFPETDELEAIRAVYDAALRDLDVATGALIDGLEARGLLEDTIVVLTADHGEQLGEHGRFNHRFSLYDTLVHVPLVVRYPAAMAPGRVGHPVSTTDIFATVLDLAGVPSPPVMARSLRDAADRGVVTFLDRPLEREVASVRGVHPDIDPAPWLREGTAVALGDEVWIHHSDGSDQVYDVAADPVQERNLAADGVPEHLRQVLATWRAELPPYDPSRRGPADDPKAVRASQEELRAELEALGYASEDAAKD